MFKNVARCTARFAIPFLFVSIVIWPTDLMAGADSPLWKRVGSWDVRVDKTLGNGCFAMAEYEGGTTFRIGFNPPNKNGYVIVGHANWKSLEEGKEYPIKLQFGNAVPWTGDATGFKFEKTDPIVFLMITIIETDLFTEFMRKTYIKVSYNEKTIAKLNLKGSYAAFEEVAKCQKAMKAGGETSPAGKDPFARGASSSLDPFAN